MKILSSDGLISEAHGGSCGARATPRRPCFSRAASTPFLFNLSTEWWKMEVTIGFLGALYA